MRPVIESADNEESVLKPAAIRQRRGECYQGFHGAGIPRWIEMAGDDGELVMMVRPPPARFKFPRKIEECALPAQLGTLFDSIFSVGQIETFP